MFLRLPRAARMNYGGSLPWGYVRSVVATRWGVLPWQVDDAPALEVSLALKLWAIEAEESGDS